MLEFDFNGEYDAEGNVIYAEIKGVDIELAQYGYGYLIRLENIPAVIRFTSRTPIDCRIGLDEEVLVSEDEMLH